MDMPSLAIGAHRRKSFPAPSANNTRMPPAEAQHCLLMRAGGILSVLDMDQGNAPLKNKQPAMLTVLSHQPRAHLRWSGDMQLPPPLLLP